MEPYWISRLLQRGRLNSQSRALYAKALLYWSAWHSCRYGTPLPLIGDPIAGVSNCILEDFVNDHIPVTRHGQASPSMDKSIFTELRRLGYNRRTPCPGQSATLWRLGVVRATHKFADLPFDDGHQRALTRRLRNEWLKADTELGVIRSTPIGRDLVLRLRSACPNTRDGMRSAAMITLLQYLTPNQLAALQFGDLIPGEVVMVSENVRGRGTRTRLAGVEVHIRHPANDFQALFNKKWIVSADADAVMSWRRTRLHDEYGNETSNAALDLPFLVRDPRKPSSSGRMPVSVKWITSNLRKLVLRAGFDAARPYDRRYRPSAIRLQCQRESASHQKLIGIAHELGIARASSFYKMIPKNLAYN